MNSRLTDNPSRSILIAVLALGAVGGAAFTLSSGRAAADKGAGASVALREAPLKGSIKLDRAAFSSLGKAQLATALAAKAGINAQRAGEAALGGHAGATVTQVNLEIERGALVYDVELDNGQDLTIDAGNGAVLLTEAGDAGENEDGDGSDVGENEDGDSSDVGETADDDADDAGENEADDAGEQEDDDADDAGEQEDSATHTQVQPSTR